MKKSPSSKTTILALLQGWIVISIGFISQARAAGRIVDAVPVLAVEDMIPGVTFGQVPYAEYRGRFVGSLTLPYDATGQDYTYDMPIWIITPANLDDGSGTVVVDTFHTTAVTSTRPSGSEGEQPLGLKQLGPKFLFRQGKSGGPTARNYTWVGVRWDPRSLTTPFPKSRYDHVYEQRHGVQPGFIGAPSDRATEVGEAMVADLADALRQGVFTVRDETEAKPFVSVKRLIAFGHSQVGFILRQLLNDPPSAANGGGPHHVPLFDGWIIGGAKAAYDQWPTISAADVVTPRAPVIYDEPPDALHGQVIEIATEADIGKIRNPSPGNEFVRYGDTTSYRSYEIAGAQHFSWGFVAVNGLPSGAILLPDLADTLSELADISGVPEDYAIDVTDAFDCFETHPLLFANPLDWNPVVRAVMVAMGAWLEDGTPPPPSRWLIPAEGEARYGDASIKRDSVGNALGGIRLPDVGVGRGRFYAVSPDLPVPGGNVNAGAYFDLHHHFANHGQYVRAFKFQARALFAARLLLWDDYRALLKSAIDSRVGFRQPLPVVATPCQTRLRR
ncbi:hypothetical protein AYO49_00920 [Verrucomicrobiaceae bacterium SCGC AG-212-N21]|nr:hypothetical protein AYO49_00920 [Verrucomicrobiaceae bacterium SCGC AG-212-N21]